MKSACFASYVIQQPAYCTWWYKKRDIPFQYWQFPHVSEQVGERKSKLIRIKIMERNKNTKFPGKKISLGRHQ